MDKLFRDVGEFDVSVFRVGEMGLKVKIYVKAVKSRSGTRYDAVGSQFDRLGGASSGNDVAGVDDTISPDGDLCAFFPLLVGFEFTDDLGVGDFSVVVGGYIPVPYDLEGVGAFDTLQCTV